MEHTSAVKHATPFRPGERPLLLFDIYTQQHVHAHVKGAFWGHNCLSLNSSDSKQSRNPLQNLEHTEINTVLLCALTALTHLTQRTLHAQLPMMAFKTQFLLLLWTQTASAQSCYDKATYSLIISPYKTLMYASASSYNCSFESGPFDFTVVNPSGRQFAFYASDGQQCSRYYDTGVYSYEPAPYSNPNGTYATFINISQAPCILYPCCVILQCQSSLGCPNLTLYTLWSNVQNSYSPPFSYRYRYVFYSVGGLGGVGGLSVALLLLSRNCRTKDENPSLAEPIVPADATEETPLKIRKAAASAYV